MTAQKLDYTDPVTTEELRRLAQLTGPCITISMPTHRTGAETRQDPIRFRNLVADALSQLADVPGGAEVRDQLEQELTDLGRDHDFWQHQTGGLVLVACADEVTRFRLASETAELAVADQAPVLSPLVEHLATDSLYRVLTVSQDSVRLLEGSFNSLAEAELGPIPADYAAAFEHLEHQKHLQHSAHSDSAQYHGHGGDPNQNRDATTRYLRAVAAGLDERLRGEPSGPLVLAGVSEVVNEFRQITGQPDVLEAALSGNHDKTPVHELHEQAWPLVTAAHALPIEQVADRIEAALPREQALADLAEIEQAAEQARVEALYLATDVESDPGLERAIRLVLQMGGEVHALPNAKRPMAALLRY